jgi:hypothetical protein
VSSDLDAEIALSSDRMLGLGTNRRRLSVTASAGDGAASVIRKLEIAPVIVDCTESRTAAGTHKA